MGNNGIRLKTPLTATGNTAPEANLEMVLFGSRTRGRPWAGADEPCTPCRASAVTQMGLNITAEAVPPT